MPLREEDNKIFFTIATGKKSMPIVGQHDCSIKEKA
jgi:hypothetical protein